MTDTVLYHGARGSVDDPITCDVLVVGAGGAGMYAAIAAARSGADVVIIDKNMVGRGGATVMAQMTVAAAVGHQEPDDWTLHYEDTLKGGKGICNQELAAILCKEAPDRILEMAKWGCDWASEDGHIKQVHAPGHSRKRCCYVDILNTGPATSSTLQAQVRRNPRIKHLQTTMVTDVMLDAGRVVGAVGLDILRGRPLAFKAPTVILACGGLTAMYARNSASSNMTADAYSLALRAGAELVDMEFVQFFPIAHLAPRLVGMDPIMWDPFRYKLGGQLLNGLGEDFLERYGAQDGGKYTATRDIVSYGILKEAEAGRGTPHGGAFLSFQHVPEPELRAAFGPVIDRLIDNGIDLTKRPVEVAPMAHYHMGGVRVNGQMETGIPGLYAAGEAVGGAQGANRLSGNAIPEAFVFGERAGRYAAQYAATVTPGFNRAAVEAGVAEVAAVGRRQNTKLDLAPSQVRPELKNLMWNLVGPLRTEAKLHQAQAELIRLESEVLPNVRIPDGGMAFNLSWQEWFELRAMLDTARVVTDGAIRRQESRGAQQREDYPDTYPEFTRNQVYRMVQGELRQEWRPVVEQDLEVIQ